MGRIAHSKRSWSLLAILALFTAISVSGQDQSKQSAKATETQPKSTKNADRKPSLADVTRVSTEEAARNAANHAAKDKAKDEETGKEGSADITEFQPAGSDDAGASTGSQTNPSASPTRKKVHGEAYGALDPKNSATHRAGGAVGATSKSGKTSVYIETDQSKSTSPTPH